MMEVVVDGDGLPTVHHLYHVEHIHHHHLYHVEHIHHHLYHVEHIL